MVFFGISGKCAIFGIIRCFREKCAKYVLWISQNVKVRRKGIIFINAERMQKKSDRFSQNK